MAGEPGSEEVFAGRLTAWRQEAGWERAVAPLLETLAATEEPVDAAVLAAWSGVTDAALVKRLCEGPLRPFLTVVPDEHRRWRLEEPGLREYVLRVIGDSAHSRIAGHFLDAFGGLTGGLATLAGEPAIGAVHGGYAQRHLARHLASAGRHADLHSLLTRGHTRADGEVVNVWFAAHEAMGTPELFLDDLSLARHHAERLTDAALAAGQPAPAFAAEVRYALMAARVRDRERGEEFGRLHTLAGVAAHLSQDSRPAILRQVLAAAIDIDDEWSRDRLLSETVKVLPGELWREALAVAHTMTSDFRRAQALGAVVSRMSAGQRDDALAELLAAARGLTDDSNRARLLAEIAEGLPAEAMTEVLAAVRAVDHEMSRVRALEGVAPHLPPRLWGRALDIARTVDDLHRWLLLAELAEHLPPQWWDDALVIARETADEHDRVRALNALAVRLPQPRRQEVLREALTVTRTIPDAVYGAQAIGEVIRAGLDGQEGVDAARTALADLREAPEGRDPVIVLGEVVDSPSERDWPHLAGDVLAAIRTVREEADRAQLLRKTAERLPREWCDEALSIARALGDEEERDRTLAVLFPHALLGREVSEAVDAVRDLSSVHFRAGVLRELAQRAEGERRAEFAREALAAARAIPDPWRVRALADVTSVLSARECLDLVREVLATVHAEPEESRAVTLAGLPLSLRAEVVGEVLSAARGITGARHRAWLMAVLSSRLPPESRDEALEEAVAAIRSLSGTGGSKAEVLGEILADLPEDPRPELVRELPAGDFMLVHQAHKVVAFLSPGQVPDVLAAISDLDDWDEKEALHDLASSLPVRLLDEALTVWPQGDAGNLVELLSRARDAHGEDGFPAMVTAVRRHLPHTDRAGCESIVREIRDTDENLLEIAAAVNDVHQWWP
ncbi:hypothetical protein ABGB18_31505 [Nonomuraea sp. B12E4]|uniref:hypothetical protein n=1 Tax=Nonomuraea sp. B12E4 TaxID=3153564 RepID=UPI00325C4109